MGEKTYLHVVSAPASKEEISGGIFKAKTGNSYHITLGNCVGLTLMVESRDVAEALHRETEKALALFSQPPAIPLA